MKKRILSLLLCIIMISGVVPVYLISASAENGYSVGEIIEYGTYPQSLVTDEELIETLEKIPADWKYYDYYTEYYTEGDRYYPPERFEGMQYTDVVYNHTKYRGVKIDEYRPFTGLTVQDEQIHTQEQNGFSEGNTYWFRFDPIKWRVLDPDEGLVLCDSLIDSQPFTQFKDYNAAFMGTYTGEYGTKLGLNDFGVFKNINAWLNSDFFDAAFSDSQKENIAESEQVNDYWYIGGNGGSNNGQHKYDAPVTNDKIFLLSWDELVNEDYGFSSSWNAADSSRVLSCTDYAKAQGIYNVSGNGFRWLIRTVCKYFNSRFSCRVDYDGDEMAIMTYPQSDDNGAYNGVCPAMRLVNLADDPTGEDMFHTGDRISFGMYPRSRVTDSEVIAALNETVEFVPKTNLVKQEYRWSFDADYYTDYADMIYDGSRYRAKVLYTDLIRESDSNSINQPKPKEYTDYDYRYTEDGFEKYVYYYLFEPITWRILNPETGLMMCDEIVDSVVYQHKHIKDDDDYWADYAWADEERTHYSTDYSVSDLRQFLTGSFYETAFTDSQKSKIETVTLDNRSYMTINGQSGFEQYDWESTSDKVFLLSVCDVLNPDYGFDSSANAKDSARVIYGNDYSGYPQGSTYDNWWPLRNTYSLESYPLRRPGACTNSGMVGTTASWADAIQPVVPAICLSDIGSDYSGETAVCTQHNPVTATLTAATCTQAGTGKIICAVCGEVLTESITISATGHTPGEEKIENETASLCTVGGSYEKAVYCTVCGDLISRQTFETGPLGHDIVHHDGKASTCKVKGYKPYDTCSRCDYTTYSELPLAGHTAGQPEIVNETFSTCETAGEYDEVIRCSVCGDLLTSEHKTKPLADHTPLDPAVENEVKSTCTGGGSYDSVIYCSVCGDVISREKVETGPLGHDIVHHDGKASTCKVKGYSPYDTCSRCDYTTFRELPLADHTPGQAIRENEKTSTCTEGGRYDSVVRCTVCGDVLSTETVTTSPDGHDYKAAVTPPDCTHKGYTTHICHCGDSFVDSYVNALGHSFTHYVYNNDATTQSDGTETAKCDRCSETDTKTAPGTKIVIPVNPTANAKIKVAGAVTLDYRTVLTIKATASGLGSDYYLVLVVDGREIKGTNTSVSCEYGEIKGNVNYYVKIVDKDNHIQKDSDGRELKKDGGRITCNAGFFKKLIAFFKGLFKILPQKTVEPK